MAIVRYDPWGVNELQSQINRLFNNWGDSESSGATSSWMPPVDILEFGDRFQLYVDLPGVTVEDVDITLDNGVLTITGERRHLVEKANEEMVRHRSERGHGQFYRRFVLPDTVDADRVTASSHDGVLEISIAKHAKAQPRRIEISH